MKKEDYKKNITMIEILAIVVSLILILLIGSKKTNSISYEITFNGIDCETPYVVFYSNDKYEYYEYSSFEPKPKPKKGRYDYSKLINAINSINKYEANDYGPYIINVSNGEKYYTYNSNIEFMQLLKENDINLERCMTYIE